MKKDSEKENAEEEKKVIQKPIGNGEENVAPGIANER